MKNRTFRYDDSHKYFMILLVISVTFIVLSIYLNEDVMIFSIFLILSFVGIIGALLIFITGIHFNYNKQKIVIIDTFFVRKIYIKDVQYITIDEIKKPRKKRKWPFFDGASYRAFWTVSSKYVYRNGKTFNIIFHMKNKTSVKSYYGWLYKTKSKNRVEKQQLLFNQFIQEFKEYKKE
jgi:hypothetical protein